MEGSIRRIIEPRARDLGGFAVRRILPAGGLQMVGPFIFLDHIGPAEFAPGSGIDVRPHPHIGLATVTYLFEGSLEHRDSLGCVQTIEPGAVNWMTAGRGIVHSERTGPGPRSRGHRIHGMQSWVALPREHEETAPAFHHHPAGTLPDFALGGARLRVIAGTAFGRTAPVATLAPTLYVDLALDPGAGLELPDEHRERAVYVAAGALAADGVPLTEGQLAVFEEGRRPALESARGARAMLVGGAPSDGPRYISWNFVSSSRERIERAGEDWKAGRFPRVPGEDEFIPLPER